MQTFWYSDDKSILKKPASWICRFKSWWHRSTSIWARPQKSHILCKLARAWRKILRQTRLLRATSKLDVSIVIATYNRLDLLRDCVEAIRGSVGALAYEIVIVDGGSEDGTLEWCAEQKDIRLIAQGELVGAIKAFNTGFMASRGEYVVHLNDDSYVLDGCIYNAWRILENPENWAVGQVAFAHKEPGTDGQYVVKGVCQLLYANFGMTRRWIGDHVGWWGNYAHTYSGDPELSLNIWARGYSVAASGECLVDHTRHQDSLRGTYNARRDNRQLKARWGVYAPPLPPAPIVTEEEVRSGNLPLIC